MPASSRVNPLLQDGRRPKHCAPPCRSGFTREEAGTDRNSFQCCSPARFNSFLHRSDKCTTRKCLPALA
ncbi:hypothetical protein DM483_08730 [Pseudomonas sp. SMT-1]|nr:hypothetical protein DM483_08730 [Pseudomonas sp. SMT-1]